LCYYNTNKSYNRPWGGHFHFIPKGMQKKKGETYSKIKNYLYANKMFIISYENLLKINLKYIQICSYFIANFKIPFYINCKLK